MLFLKVSSAALRDAFYTAIFTNMLYCFSVYLKELSGQDYVAELSERVKALKIQ